MEHKYLSACRPNNAFAGLEQACLLKLWHTAILALLFTLATLPTAASDPPSQWKTIERLTYDWCGGSVPYEFVLRVPVDYGSGGDFTRLEILRGGQVIFTVTDDDGIAKYNTTIISVAMKERSKPNLLPSEHLLMLSSVTGNSRCPLLFLFGWLYGSFPGSLHVISMNYDGIPIQIVSRQNFSLWDIRDLDKDMVPEFIGKQCFYEQRRIGMLDVLGYSPFSVYRFGATAASPMVLDMALSQKYNETQYYGWAGINCSEHIVIVLHPPGGGKPVIMKAEEVKALNKTDIPPPPRGALQR